MTGKLFMGGVPTKPDVDRLMQFEIIPDSHVTYDEIERATGLRYGTHRFSGVVSAWRRQLFRERAIQTKARGGAIHFLSADGAQDEVGVKMVRVGRATGRMVRDAGMIRTSELSTEERRGKHLLIIRESAALLDAHRAANKAIAGPSPTQSRPLRIVGELMPPCDAARSDAR